jgi:hypothetical protein
VSSEPKFTLARIADDESAAKHSFSLFACRKIYHSPKRNSAAIYALIWHENVFPQPQLNPETF